MNPDQAIEHAVRLIASVPGYGAVGRDLCRTRICYCPDLSDRGQATLRGAILIGPEALMGVGDAALVSLAGTLVHEHWHTRQNPFLKTLSFWQGVFSRTHPMRRYERPAYERQVAFLKTLSVSQPGQSFYALSECDAVLASYLGCYGDRLEERAAK